MIGLKRGFEAIGCEASASWPLLEPNVLSAFVAAYKPDIVFEVNRPRSDLHDCEGHFLHVAWIEGARYGTRWLTTRYADSDLLYLMCPPELLGVEKLIEQPWRYLWPGADPDVFRPKPIAPSCDLSFVGHLYGPLPASVTDAGVAIQGSEFGPLSDLISTVESWTLDALCRPSREIVRSVVAHYRSRGAVLDPADIDRRVAFLIDEYLPRTISRTRIARLMLRVSSDTHFHGNAGWVLWPEFMHHYRGELIDPNALATVFRTSKVNVHFTPWPYHFRTIDCMATGGLILVNRVEDHAYSHGFNNDFTDGDHYIGYTEDDFVETASAVLADPVRRARIAAAAAARVAEAHTWRHRAEQILDDLEWPGYR